MTNAIALDPAVAHAISPRGRHLLDMMNANLKTWDKVRTREDQTGKEVAASVVVLVHQSLDDGIDPCGVLEQCAMQLQARIDYARQFNGHDRALRREYLTIIIMCGIVLALLPFVLR